MAKGCHESNQSWSKRVGMLQICFDLEWFVKHKRQFRSTTNDGTDPPSQESGSLSLSGWYLLTQLNSLNDHDLNDDDGN